MTRAARRSTTILVAVLLAAEVMLGASRVSTAQDDSRAFRDIATASDFRVRVAAALALGKSKRPGARPALEKALNDAHPAVRSAAAAALGQLGDPASIPALRNASAREHDAGVKNEMEAVIGRLSPGAKKTKAKYLVKVGKVDNKSGTSGPTLLDALRDSTKARMAQVAGVEVLPEGTDLVTESKSRNLPAFSLDGTLMQLAKKQASDSVGYAARVEYLIRKMPEQVLKGTMSGNATALADAKQVHGQSELTQLQIDALAAAVDGALKGVGSTLEAAAR